MRVYYTKAMPVPTLTTTFVFAVHVFLWILLFYIQNQQLAVGKPNPLRAHCMALAGWVSAMDLLVVPPQVHRQEGSMVCMPIYQRYGSLHVLDRPSFGILPG